MERVQFIQLSLKKTPAPTFRQLPAVIINNTGFMIQQAGSL